MDSSLLVLISGEMAEPLTRLGKTGKGKEQCRNWQVPELGHGESSYEHRRGSLGNDNYSTDSKHFLSNMPCTVVNIPYD